MKHVNYRDVEAEIPEMEGIKDIKIRWLISDKDGASNFAMRLFEVEPGGYSPWHQHEFEHEMFIVEGSGTAVKKDGEIKISVGDVLFIEPNEWHNFKNTGSEVLKFLCLVPYPKKD